MTSEERKEGFNVNHDYNEIVEENIDERSNDKTIEIPFIEWTTRCEDLLYFFGSYKAAGTLRDNEFLDKSFTFCSELFRRDGDIIIIDNYGKQELCDSYPMKIIIQESFIKHIESNNTNNHTTTTNNNNYEYLSRLLERARYARVHRRFVVPVIFLPNNACIARSSTLSTTGELLLNKATTVVSEALNYCPNSMESPMGHDLNALRAADIKLLKYFNIKFICDLMVEDKKKVGWGRYALTVTSSEKVDREQRYRDFNLSSIPYPGCEFFKRYKDNNHDGNKLVFSWDSEIHDAKLNLHWLNDDEFDDETEDNNYINTGLLHHDINWNDYQKWDIIELTQNYLRLIIDYIQSSFSNTFTNRDNNDSNIGILIHCISGWDRTPLFISLIRLSLWADGIIHCDLDSSEILYLTLSYDWLLFTHQFGNRLIKGEDIFHFTFFMLQYIINDTYSIFYSNNNGYNNQLLIHSNNHQNKINESKTLKLIKTVKKFSKLTKEQTMKISKVTKNSSNKLLSKFKSRSNSNMLQKSIQIDVDTNHFDHYNTNTNTLDVSNSSLDEHEINIANINNNNNGKYKSMNTNTLEVSNSSLESNGIIKHKMTDYDHRFSPFSPPLQIVSNPIPIKNINKSKSVNIAPLSNNYINTASNNNNNNNNSNILSHSWEKKGCGPLTSNIRHSYIPTLLTPPAFQKNRNILSLSINKDSNNNNNNNNNISNNNISNSDPTKPSLNMPPLPQPTPLQIVRTLPLNSNTTPRNGTGNNSKYKRLTSWQFVDNKNDSPMFQFISTPKSDPPTHCQQNIAPPELNLSNPLDDTHVSINSPATPSRSSNSSGDIKINKPRHSLSAPSSAKKYVSHFMNFKDFVMNGSPSPEVVAHPETNIIDIMDYDENSQQSTHKHIYHNLFKDVSMMSSMSKDEEQELERTLSISRSSISQKYKNYKSEIIAKALINNIINNVVINSCKNNDNEQHLNYDEDEDDEREISQDLDNNDENMYKLNRMKSAKSTPVTISDFLGLDGVKKSIENIQDHHFDEQHIEKRIDAHSEQDDDDDNDDDNDNNNNSNNNHRHIRSLSDTKIKDLTHLAPQLKKVESFEINVDDVLEPIYDQQQQQQNDNDNDNDDEQPEYNTFCIKDNGRLIASNRADRLMQIYNLFNKIYTQVMIINDPPTFYKQSVQNNGNNIDDDDGDDIDFISTEKYHSYFTNQQSDSYNNITTYLKSMLPASLIGNQSNDNNIDEYDDNDD